MSLLGHFRRIVPLLTCAATLCGAGGADAQQRAPEPVTVLAKGGGWRLVDFDSGGGTGLNSRMWQLSEDGIANLPVSQAQKDMLSEAFADDPEDGAVIFMSEELLQAMEHPDFPAGYEPYIDHQQLDDDGTKEARPGSQQASLSLCGWGSTKTQSKAFDFSELDIDHDFNIGDHGGLDGNLRLNLPLQGHVDVTGSYKIRKCFGIPTGFKFVGATAVGNAAMNGSGSLDVSATYTAQYEHEWSLGEPHLGDITFTVYGFPVRIKFTLPLYAGVTLDAKAAGTISAQIDATAAGTFNYACTRDDCTGSSNFTDEFDVTGPTGSIQVDLKAAAHARVMVRAALYDADIAYVEGGIKPYVQVGIWGYYGNNCGDANGDGQNETVSALAADLRWGYKFAYSAGALWHEGSVHYTGGSEHLLAWRDLLGNGGSTVFQPMLVGPSSIGQGEPVSYIVRMRPCYPYDEAVNFTVAPGTWTGGNVISDPPFGGPTIQSTFANAGNQTLVVTATTDAAGRNLQNSSSRVLTVNPAAPAAPTGLTTTVLSTSSVRLNWTDNSTVETGFEIQRRLLPQGSFAQLVMVTANTTTYTDSGLSPATGYEYRVRARNINLASGWSNGASATTADVAPAAPTGLSATVLSATSARLNWTDASNNENNFEVQRRLLPSGGFATIVSAAQNSTTYTDNGLAASSSYEYRVRARNTAGPSSFSNVASATTSPVVPTAPANLSATALSATSVRLNWTDTSSNETGFEVQRRPAGGVFALLVTASANAVTWTDNSVAPLTTYEYRVRAVNAAGGSTFTSIASVTTPQAVPAAPSGLSGAYNSGTNQYVLTWTDNSNNEQGFNLWSSFNGGAFADMGYVGANVTSYVLLPLPAGSYQFVVRSYIGGSASGWSNVAPLTVTATASTSIAWIQPAESSWGPAGTLTAAGYATNGTGGVQLVWRERSSAGVWGAWTTVAYQPPPSPDTTWSNTISSGNPTNKCHWFDAYTNYSGATSPVFHYTGAPGCP